MSANHTSLGQCLCLVLISAPHMHVVNSLGGGVPLGGIF